MIFFSNSSFRRMDETDDAAVCGRRPVQGGRVEEVEKERRQEVVVVDVVQILGHRLTL